MWSGFDWGCVPSIYAVGYNIGSTSRGTRSKSVRISLQQCAYIILLSLCQVRAQHMLCTLIQICLCCRYIWDSRGVCRGPGGPLSSRHTIVYSSSCGQWQAEGNGTYEVGCHHDALGQATWCWVAHTLTHAMANVATGHCWPPLGIRPIRQHKQSPSVLREVIVACCCMV